MNAAEKILSAKDKIQQIAVECLDKADGNVAKAISIFVGRAKKENWILRELIAPIVFAAAEEKIRHKHRSNRENIVKMVDRRVSANMRIANQMTPIDVPVANQRASAEAFATVVARSLLDFPLLGGKRLGEATRTEVTAAADHYEKQGTTMLHRAKWLKMIAQHLESDKAVGEIMDEKRVLELWEECKNAS